jgi:UDP-N-acetylenolpyruvoylglucosamine reductase
VVLKVEGGPAGASSTTAPRPPSSRFGAGENWHEAVAWTIDQGLGGLENLA